MSLCQVRGCDDVPQARPAWYGLGLTSEVCPVLSFTPDVEGWLDLFDLTHDTAREPAARIGFPAAGGALDQDAKDMDALNVIRHARSLAIGHLAKAAAHG